MKNLKCFLVIILTLGITACVDGQIRRTVYGNNHVVKKERDAGNFSGLRVSSGIDVYLKQTDDESIVVEADENLHEYIQTEIRDGILSVYTEANIREAEMKRVYVTMRDINSLKTTQQPAPVISNLKFMLRRSKQISAVPVMLRLPVKLIFSMPL
ncbi:MAG: hypothetical protein H6R35_69 [Bacteroidetes bacterium]|nr:hypothetical protein [Bacteroidota bacterium]